MSSELRGLIYILTQHYGKAVPNTANYVILRPRIQLRQRRVRRTFHPVALSTVPAHRATMAAALQERLQTESAEFQKIQAELSSVVEARQKLDAQLSENELVKKVRRIHSWIQV